MIYNETSNSCLYRVGNSTQTTWTNGIYEIFNGNVTPTPTSNMDFSPDFSGIVMEGLYHDNLSISFASVAIALTKRVRTVAYGQSIAGHAFRNVPYFQASMYWLIYPGTVILLACLLMATISTKAVRYPIWKDSAAALLHIGGQAREHGGHVAVDSNDISRRELKERTHSIKLQISSH